MLTLYALDGCPYAQRSRAQLTHRAIAFDLRLIDPRNKPADFLALSPTGRVPLLVDDDATLYESAIINEYLREKFEWTDGLSRGVYQRARERLAMAQFDSVIVPAFWASLKAGGALDEQKRKAVERELEELEKTAEAADARVNLLGLHVITHVIRWRWLGDATPFPALLAARPVLTKWLDELAALPAIESTLPDREKTVAMIHNLVGSGRI